MRASRGGRRRGFVLATVIMMTMVVTGVLLALATGLRSSGRAGVWAARSRDERDAAAAAVELAILEVASALRRGAPAASGALDSAALAPLGLRRPPTGTRWEVTPGRRVGTLGLYRVDFVAAFGPVTYGTRRKFVVRRPPRGPVVIKVSRGGFAWQIARGAAG